MEHFFTDHAYVIGLSVSLFVGLFGLAWTMLERKLIVSRKHVTGTNGFTYTVVGACAAAVSVYVMKGSIVAAAMILAVFIAAYSLICRFIEKKEYPQEDRYTKE